MLAAITGSPYFPGGSGSFSAPAGSFLEFEYGPSVTVNLKWATYFDAADEAGVSRRWGGIHPRVDDLPARLIGMECGQQAWALAPKYWNGSIIGEGMSPGISRPTASTAVLVWDTQPGLWYSVERSTGLSAWSRVHGPVQATDSRINWTDEDAVSASGFYRIVQTTSP